MNESKYDGTRDASCGRCDGVNGDAVMGVRFEDATGREI